MKVASLNEERSALVSAATSRALMLERHERAAELFAHIIRLRYDLSSITDLNPKSSSHVEEISLTEVC